MALPKNRKAVRAILQEISPRVIGGESGPFSCGCGAISHGPAVAVAIKPAGDSYPGQEVHWYLWRVLMAERDRTPDGLGYDYSIGLSAFIPVEELEEIFVRHFGKASEEEERLYSLDVSGEERFYLDLPTAVRIHENDHQTRFCFDWGVDQDAAEALNRLYLASPKRIPAGSEPFQLIVEILDGLDPEIYQGGPNPDVASHIFRFLTRFMPFLKDSGIFQPLDEGGWSMNYGRAFKKAVRKADHIFFQNMASHWDQRGSVETQADVVFMMVPVQ